MNVRCSTAVAASAALAFAAFTSGATASTSPLPEGWWAGGSQLNNHFFTDSSTNGDGETVTLGLRARYRNIFATAPSGSTYSFSPTGGNANSGQWNVDISITGQANYAVYLAIDIDPADSQNFIVINAETIGGGYDALAGRTAPYSYNFNNGADTETLFNAALDLQSTVGFSQQSQQVTWLAASAFNLGDAFALAGFDQHAAGTYDFVLFAVEDGAGSDGTPVASVSMRVSVVPAPHAAGLGLLGLGALSARRRRA